MRSVVVTLTSAMLAVVTPAVYAAPQPSVAVRTTTLRWHALSQTITAFGIVEPDPTALTTIDATAAAFVRQVEVTLGQPVHRGEPLLVMRTAPSARARYLSARAEVRYARRALARARELLKQKLATRAEVDAAENALQKAKAVFAALQELGAGKTTRVIRAPFTGIVSRLPIKPGDAVKAGTQLLQLARRDRLAIALGVEPEEVRQVRVGMPVVLTPLFGRQAGVEAKINQVDAVVNPSTRLVDVIVHLRDADAMAFLPGMRVKGTITLSTHHLLAVPRSAILRDEKGAYLFVVKVDKARRVDVRVGLKGGGLVGVRGDLKAGERVVIEGNYELSNGMPVRQAP